MKIKIRKDYRLRLRSLGRADGLHRPIFPFRDKKLTIGWPRRPALPNVQA